MLTNVFLNNGGRCTVDGKDYKYGNSSVQLPDRKVDPAARGGRTDVGYACTADLHSVDLRYDVVVNGRTLVTGLHFVDPSMGHSYIESGKPTGNYVVINGKYYYPRCGWVGDSLNFSLDTTPGRTDYCN